MFGLLEDPELEDPVDGELELPDGLGEVDGRELELPDVPDRFERCMPEPGDGAASLGVSTPLTGDTPWASMPKLEASCPAICPWLINR